MGGKSWNLAAIAFRPRGIPQRNSPPSLQGKRELVDEEAAQRVFFEVKRVTREARALTQALLAHHKRLRCRRIDDSKTLESCLLSYGDLCDQAGLARLKPEPGKFLREIAYWCHENGWPPLNSLAVNHQSRRPGHGYDSAAGCSLEYWRDQAAACIGFNGYPESVDE